MYTGIHMVYMYTEYPEENMEQKNGYRAIADELGNEIASGKLRPGELLPPERVLCERWNVERTTLRRALALLSDEGLIEKRPGVGSIVRDRSKELISFITTGGSADQAAQVNELEHHFMSPVCDCFSRICAKNGRREVSVTLTGNVEGRLESFRNLLDSSQALVLADNIPMNFLETAKRVGKPCVLFSQREKGFRSVLCDNDSGLSQAVDCLYALGHRNIAFLGGDERFLNSRARVDGFKRAMQSHGLNGEVIQCGWSDVSGYDGFLKLISINPAITAVCCVNDQVAYGVCKAVNELGKKVGVDVSVIGFGDTKYSRDFEYQITSVRIPPERVARELWRALRWEIESPFTDPATVLVEAELIVRGTTGKVQN